MVDLSQDQDQLSGEAAKPGAIFGNDSREGKSAGPDAEANLDPKPEEAQPHSQSTGKKRSGRPARGRQEALQDACAADMEAGGHQPAKKIQRHSKSGVEVEVEEI